VKDLKGVKIIDDDIETVLPPVNPEVEKPIVKTEPTPRKNIDKLIIVDDVNKKTTEEPTKEDPYVEPKFDDKWVEVEPPVIDPDPIDYPDEMPGFIGGDKALYQYLSNNIKYPKIEIKRGVEGRVYVEFVVGKNGEISDIKILRGVSESIDAEAIRVIKAMPNWLPGKQKGRAVKVRYKMPISFKLIK
tara:strand:+ start:150947 stop:151510 length:564 start_codon:yes stop_codon:yes gene_type:complete